MEKPCLLSFVERRLFSSRKDTAFLCCGHTTVTALQRYSVTVQKMVSPKAKRNFILYIYEYIYNIIIILVLTDLSQQL